MGKSPPRTKERTTVLYRGQRKAGKPEGLLQTESPLEFAVSCSGGIVVSAHKAQSLPLGSATDVEGRA